MALPLGVRRVSLGVAAMPDQVSEWQARCLCAECELEIFAFLGAQRRQCVCVCVFVLPSVSTEQKRERVIIWGFERAFGNNYEGARTFFHTALSGVRIIIM